MTRLAGYSLLLVVLLAAAPLAAATQIYDDFASGTLDLEKWVILAGAPELDSSVPGVLGLRATDKPMDSLQIRSVAALPEETQIEISLTKLDTPERGPFRFGFFDADKETDYWIQQAPVGHIVVDGVLDPPTRLVSGSGEKATEFPAFKFRIKRNKNEYAFYHSTGAEWNEIGVLTSEAIGSNAYIFIEFGGLGNTAWIDYIAIN